MIKIQICLGSSCYSRGSHKNIDIISNYLKEKDIEKKVEVSGNLCEGNCAKGPVIKINNKIYTGVDQVSLITILDNFFKSEGII